MTTVPVPDGFILRPPTRADAPAVAALIATYQVAQGDPPTMTTAELLNIWESIDPTNEAIIIDTPDGIMVAYADLLDRRHVQTSVYGHVHPDFTGRGLGTAIVRWGEDWTTERVGNTPPAARIEVQHYLRSTNAAAQYLLVRHGYTPRRAYYEMGVMLDDPIPPPDWPTGFAVRTFRPGQDEETIYAVGEETFRDIWGRPPSTRERWLAATHSTDFDATLWYLVTDSASDTVVGLCLCAIIGTNGYVNQVGIRRPWRHQGLGLAMLRHAFHHFAARGIRDITLSVDADSTTGAPQLYLRAGMVPRQSYILHRKELRPGVDLDLPIGAAE